MRFGVMTLIDNVPDARSGHLPTPHDRLREVIELAVPAEELDLDAFGVGERHGAPFLSSSPWGDPVFAANVIQPVANYARLTDRYRAHRAAYGHDPSAAVVVGSGGTLHAAADDRTARREFAPYYEAAVAARDVPGNNTPFRSPDEAADHGPALVGSPGRIVDKIVQQHAAYGHALQFLSVDSAGLLFHRRTEVPRLTAAEVLPQLRHDLPDTLPWPSAAVAPVPRPAPEAAR
ncbi:LLM class flavin-dependent oxidoreductase [Streptomyces sp. Je 1-4]|uniref:LLM class flavin-dependent oxidoreductase n=1 Tax=Streptomyces TaxID=1883 RepID=UPI00140EA01F|nr:MULTISPECIES: LLM class flavin-dependent oxidoreductase [unclassified Streptomyces]QIK09520.1 LLM class flavin-dependent oxidoreductase [Streptomyces sp. ID38640]UYB43227.1 LLM class flavin-dependent oxidoreductase [Streptomyces sp. Je 1-4]UZQ39593.1 LLM class flavin-dependent oxidoreductase [Streptomyces sp. Je 1-4] [Streptomyces sp. Je 1-4 4N24]UZQ47010.1 LLM class flavin-dependent oxidoreductase [Streptomyces sp. Je 1-4] [Streptomyces sp. Je 1-4 4N24_ara]